MADCIFCKIVSGEIKKEFVYQDEDVVVFHDIHPRAPMHVLVVPKEHFKSLNELAPERVQLGGRILAVAAQVAAKLGLRERGYRAVINIGPDSGSEVDHFHLHIVGGKQLSGFGVKDS